jgi:D-glycero-D-manno-heptose 1,7-bisphosphate phosphatase
MDPLACFKLLTPVTPPAEPHPALFLDRDDTLIPDVPYLRDPSKVRLFPNALEGLRLLRDSGYRLILVSNQSGVGRGLIAPEELRAVHARLVELLREGGVELDAAYFCPHRPEDACRCRKPGIGMLEEARRDFVILNEGSAMAGDREADLLMAKNGGLTAIQVLSAGRAPLPQADHHAADLFAAAQWLLSRHASTNDILP